MNQAFSLAGCFKGSTFSIVVVCFYGEGRMGGEKKGGGKEERRLHVVKTGLWWQTDLE